MKTVAAGYYYLLVALAAIAGATIALAFVLIVVDVGIRAAGRQPPAYTSAVVELILLYFTLLAAPYLVRRKAHVFVNVLISRLTGRVRWTMEKIAYSVCVATALTFAYVGFGLMIEGIQSGSFEDRSIDVPVWIAYAPLGPIFLLVAIEFGRYLIGIDSMYVDRAIDDRVKAPDSL